MINLHHLRVFYAVACADSFSQAAGRLSISQPAVSMQVKKLEEALGLALYEQVGKHLMLTQAGQLLKEYAARIFGLEAEAEAALVDLKGVRRGRLEVAASTTPGAFLLPRTLGLFQQRHPTITVDLYIANTQAVARRLALGELDCGVLGQDTGHRDLVLEPLAVDRLVLVAAPGHPLAAGGPVRLADVCSQPFILREQGSATREAVLAGLAAQGSSVRVAMSLGSLEAIKQAVAAGLGVTVISRWAVQWELSQGLLVELALPGIALSRHFYLAYHRQKRLSAAAKAFITTLREVAAAAE